MEPAKILSDFNLKRTSCREGIIEVIIEAGNALSENEIRTRLSGNYDRSTFYRSFKTLVDKHIIHKIVVDNNLVKYALDNAVTHKKEHAHFYCNKCKTVQCLENITVEIPPLPKGYDGGCTEILIKGVCASCQNN